MTLRLNRRKDCSFPVRPGWRGERRGLCAKSQLGKREFHLGQNLFGAQKEKKGVTRAGLQLKGPEVLISAGEGLPQRVSKGAVNRRSPRLQAGAGDNGEQT